MVFDFDERKDISTTLVSVETLSMTSSTTYMLVGNLCPYYPGSFLIELILLTVL